MYLRIRFVFTQQQNKRTSDRFISNARTKSEKIK